MRGIGLGGVAMVFWLAGECAADISIDVVAQAGETLNDGTLLRSFEYAPYINRLGQVLLYADSSNAQNLAVNKGVYRASGLDDLVPIAQLGKAVAGETTPVTAIFPGGGFINNSGQVALTVGFGDHGATILSSSGPSPQSQEIVRGIINAPNGGTADVAVTGLNDTGQASMYGSVSTSTSGYGIALRASQSAVTEIARADGPGPNGQTYAGLSQPVINNTGQLAFVGQYLNDSNSNDTVGRGAGPSSLTELYHGPSGTPASNWVSLNDAGQAIFGANNAIYRSSGPGGLAVIASEGQTIPGDSDRIRFIGPANINPSGTVVFTALRARADGSPDGAGLFVGSSPGLLTELLRTDQLVPDGTATFNQLFMPSINSRGQIAFEAFLSDSSTAVFLIDQGRVIQIARDFESPDGQAMRVSAVYNDVNPGGRAPLNDLGQITFSGSYGPVFDQKAAIFRSHPYPSLAPGDVDGNGRVDFSDLLTLAQFYGQPGSWGMGDFNGDGRVDFADLLLLAQHYGQAVAGAQATEPQLQPVSVPEPGPAWNLLLSMIPLGCRRSRARP